MNKFSQWIRNLQARINQLKTIGVKSSSSLGIYSEVVQIPNDVNYAWIVLTSSEPMLFSVYIETPTELRENDEYLYTLRAATDEEHRDIVIVRKDDDAPQDMGLSIRVVATSVFSANLEIKE